MTQTFLVPLSRIPLDLAQVQSAIIQGLGEFGHIAPAIWYQTSKSGTHALEEGDVQVQGRSPEDACRVAFYGLDIGAREPAESDLAYMASVSKPGSLWFAGAIAFGLAMTFGGRVVYDDSHIFGSADFYTVGDLRRALDEGSPGK